MGKKTKFRQCPAAGREITASDCAVGRHRTYACPETCPFNLFSIAEYEKERAVEHSADAKFLQWVKQHAADPEAFESDMRRLLEDSPNQRFFHSLAWHGMYRVGPKGLSCLGEWEQAGFPGLNADEAILMRGRTKMRPTMLEAQCILDHQRIQGVDLLDPARAPLLVVDRGLAAQAVRFEVYATNLFPLPHYSRVFGTCVMVPNFHPLPMEEVIAEIIRHRGGGADLAAMRDWLKEHYSDFHESLSAVGLARRKAMFEAIDGQFGKAVYELKAPFAECRERLRQRAEIASDDLRPDERKEGFTEGRVWFAVEKDPTSAPEQEGAVLGRVLLGPTHWRLETMGAERLADVRARFETLMGERVRFAGERLDDLAARLRQQEPAYDPALVPAALLRDTPRLSLGTRRVQVAPGTDSHDPATAAAFIEDEQRGILDEPIPALGGKTPRQATSAPSLRKALILWLKYWISQTDRRNLETGRNEDTNWMVRELGITELLFDPPPPRPRRVRQPEPDDDDDWPGAGVMDAPPPLPDRPWTNEEAARKCAAAMQAFASPSEQMTYFMDVDYPLFVDLQQALASAGMLKADDFPFIFEPISCAVLSFAPPGTVPPRVTPERLGALLAEWLQGISTVLKAATPEGFPEGPLADWMDKSRQPGLLKLLAAVGMRALREAPSNRKPPPTCSIVMLGALAAVIDALDEAARRR